MNKPRKRCCKFTHISQSCEQEDFKNSNNFVRLIGPIIELNNVNNTVNKTHVFFNI